MATKEVVPPAGPAGPSRYEQVLNQRVTEQAEKLVANVQAAQSRVSLPWWGIPAVGVGLGAVAVMMLLIRQDGPDKNSMPMGKGSVISTGSVGVQANVEEMLPRHPSPSPPASAAPSMIPSPAAAALLKRDADAKPSPKPYQWPRLDSAKSGRRAAADCPTCRLKERQAATPSPAPVALAAPLPAPTPTPAPKPALNVGSRFTAVLTYPVRTAFAGSPVTATVSSDIAPNGPVAIPAGSTLVGQAFATDSDDRAQIIFTAVVRDGRTVQFRAIALDTESNLGIQGKVIRKASATKKGAGRVLGALGSAVTFGLVGNTEGVLGDAAATLASQSAMDLSQLDRTWSMQRSDKVVEVKASTKVTVYVQSDLAAVP